jgi:hypothetical protein
VQDGIGSALQGLFRTVWGVPSRSRRATLAEPVVTQPERTRVEPALQGPPLQVLRRSQELQRVYAEMVRVSAERDNRYKDYEDMILDPTVSGGIEMMVDDACQYDRDQGATIWVRTDDPQIRRAAEELFDKQHVEERVFDWGFNTAMYGDMMMQVFGEDGRGVVSIDDDWHPADVQRVDINGHLVGFRTPRAHVETTQAQPGDSIFWDPWDFVHFNIQASQRRRREIERQRMMPSVRFEREKYRVTTRYGVSVVEAVRRCFKQLMMVEQSLVISRMSKALTKYLYKVQCGEQGSVKDAARTVMEMRDLLTQQTGIKLGEDFEQQYNPLSGSEDVFLPVFGEKGAVDVQTLGGDVNISSIVDVDRLTKKFFGGLKIPAAFLGFSDEIPSSLGDGNLVRLEIRYARTVKRVQRAILQGCTRLLQIHLAYKRINPDPKRFAVEMAVISSAEEEERKASLSNAASVASELANLNQSLHIKMPVKRFAKKVYQTILGVDEDMVAMIDDAEEVMDDMGEAGGTGGGDLGGGLGGMDIGPTEGPLDNPPEDEEEEGALDLPPEDVAGKLPAPESAPKKRKFKGLAESAKRQAVDGVTKMIRTSGELQAPLPQYTGGSQRKISRIKTAIGSEKSVLGKVIREAVSGEIEAGKRERAFMRKKVEEIVAKTNEILVLTEGLGEEK